MSISKLVDEFKKTIKDDNQRAYFYICDETESGFVNMKGEANIVEGEVDPEKFVSTNSHAIGFIETPCTKPFLERMPEFKKEKRGDLTLYINKKSSFK